MKCPYCGSLEFNKREQPEKMFYAITKVDMSKAKPEFMPGEGIPIELYGCLACGGLVPYSKKINN